MRAYNHIFTSNIIFYIYLIQLWTWHLKNVQSPCVHYESEKIYLERFYAGYEWWVSPIPMVQCWTAEKQSGYWFSWQMWYRGRQLNTKCKTENFIIEKDYQFSFLQQGRHTSLDQKVKTRICLRNLQNLTLSSKRRPPHFFFLKENLKNVSFFFFGSLCLFFFKFHSTIRFPTYICICKIHRGISVWLYTSSSPVLWRWSFQLWPSDLSSSSYSMLSPPVPDTPLADPDKWSGPCGEPDWEMFFFETSPPFAGVAEVDDGILRTWSLYFCKGDKNFQEPPH